MTDKKNPKIASLKDYQKKDPLRQLYQEGREMLTEGNDPYTLALSMMVQYLNQEQVMKNEKNIIAFLDKYEPNSEVVVQLASNEALANFYQGYMLIIHMLYLLNHSKGQQVFQKAVDWLPQTKEEKEFIRSWQSSYVFSVFAPKKKNGKFCFVDTRNGKEYLTQQAYEKVVPNHIDVSDQLYMTIVFPLPKGQYTALPTCYCENGPALKKILNSSLDKSQLVDRLLLLYRDYLADIGEKFGADEAEDYDPEDYYYPMERLPQESDRHLAQRILDQDEELTTFPYRQVIEELMIKVFKEFSQLILPRANALPLVDGIKEIFMDAGEASPEMDALRGDELDYFWYLFIEANFPQEVQRIRHMMEKAEFHIEDYFPDEY